MAVFVTIELYFLCGFVCAVFFLTFGVTRALGYPVKVSTGARIVLLPGAVLLWPLVVVRWLKAVSGR